MIFLQYKFKYVRLIKYLYILIYTECCVALAAILQCKCIFAAQKLNIVQCMLSIERIVCGGAVVPRSPSASPQAFVLLLRCCCCCCIVDGKSFRNIIDRSSFSYSSMVAAGVATCFFCDDLLFIQRNTMSDGRERDVLGEDYASLFIFSFSRWFCCCAISCLVASPIVIGTSIDYIRLHNRNIRSKKNIFIRHECQILFILMKSLKVIKINLLLFSASRARAYSLSYGARGQTDTTSEESVVVGTTNVVVVATVTATTTAASRWSSYFA